MKHMKVWMHHIWRIAALSLLCTAQLVATPVFAQESVQPLHIPLVTNNFDSRWSWTISGPLDLTPKPRNAPVVVIDSRGRLHVFWDTLYSPRFIYHVYLTKKGWTEPQPVAASLGSSTLLFAPLALNDGSMHLLWRTDLGYNSDPHYQLLYAKFDGKRWTESEVALAVDRSSYQGIVQTNADGRIRITVAETLWLSHILQLERSLDGWTSTVVPTPDHRRNWVWPDRTGGIHYFGRDSGGGTVYSYWRDGVMQQSNLSISGPDTLPLTKLDSDNNLHVYERGQVPVPGGTVYGVRHQCMRNDLTWDAQETVSGHHAVDGLPLAAVDRGGQFVLAWKESGYASRFELWDGCTKTGKTLLPLEKGVTLRAMAVQSDPGKACVLYSESTYVYRAVCTGL